MAKKRLFSYYNSCLCPPPSISAKLLAKVAGRKKPKPYSSMTETTKNFRTFPSLTCLALISNRLKLSLLQRPPPSSPIQRAFSDEGRRKNQPTERKNRKQQRGQIVEERKVGSLPVPKCVLGSFCVFFSFFGWGELLCPLSYVCTCPSKWGRLSH